MINALTRTQGQRLCELIHLLRPEWDLPGITAAVRKAAEIASGPEVCVAALRVAANLEARTPGLIPQPGPHWQQTTAGKNLPPTPCGIHPSHPALGCPECKAIPKASPEQIKAARERARRLAAGKPGLIVIEGREEQGA